MPTFEPPTKRVRLFGRRGRFEDKWLTNRGQSVWKKDGVWTTQEGPDWNTLASADALPAGDTSETAVPGRYAWTGGHVYTVSSTIGTELQAAGYTVS